MHFGQEQEFGRLRSSVAVVLANSCIGGMRPHYR